MNDRKLYHILIAHPRDQAILVKKDKHLPVIRFSGCVVTDLTHLCELTQKELGCDFRLIQLRKECESFFPQSGNPGIYHCTLVLFEIPDDEDPTAPEGYRWIPKVDAHNICVKPRRPGVVEYLEKYKTEGLEINTNLLLPFSRAGWYRNACVWIKEELAKHGNEVKSISQLRSGADSCVLRATSKSGLQFYMKAVTPGGWYEEVKVTKALSEVMPEHFPQVLSYNLDKKWLLMRDCGETMDFEAFSAEQNPELMQQVLSRWAEVQKRSIPLKERLVRSGVPIMDGLRLKQELLKMLEDPEWFKAQREGMSDDERQRYVDQREYRDKYIEFVDRLLKKVSKYRVPLALVHGDLNPVNIIERGEDNHVFIDLFSTQISFPFLDAVSLARDLSGGDLDLYLKFWTSYESIERLRELLFIVREIQLVQNNVSQYLMYSMGEKSERLYYLEECQFTVIHTFNKYEEEEDDD